MNDKDLKKKKNLIEINYNSKGNLKLFFILNILQKTNFLKSFLKNHSFYL